MAAPQLTDLSPQEEIDSALRDDVRLLGDLLGTTLRSQVSSEFYDTVERIRLAAKGARAGSPDDSILLEQALAKLPAPTLLALARAFTQFLALANIAEQHHQVRCNRRALRAGEPLAHSVSEGINRLLESGIEPEKLYQSVCDLSIELVLTAHPTEVTRRTLLQKYNRIAETLGQRDRLDLTPEERVELVEALQREIVSIWETDEVRRHHISPVEEARSGFVVVEQTLWNVLPRYLRMLDRALYSATGKSLPLDAAPIRFGSWMGGDRDGNPNVTPEVTRRVCLFARWMATNLYYREVELLRGELSMRSCNEELRQRVGDTHEPYRELLREVRAKLTATRSYLEAELRGHKHSTQYIFHSAAEFRELLLVCYHSLHDCGVGVVADGRLLDLIRRLQCFGLTLTRLDIRQEADRHTEALDAITNHLGLGSYLEWDEDKRQAFLVEQLSNTAIPVLDDLPANDKVRKVLDTFKMLAEIDRDSLGAYVISMATQPSDVLAVELLQKHAGVTPALRVVPLFERLDALRSAGACMDRLFRTPWYRDHCAGRQEVMIGYSDSAKDAGWLTAAWALYQAQEELVAVCKRHAAKLTLFHGRGGSVGRGGGPTHAAILSHPPGAVAGSLRVTEQGEVIQAHYGQPGIALQTLSTYTLATLEATLAPPLTPRPEWRQLLDQLSQTALKTFRGIVQEHEQFVEYFRAATPEEEIGRLQIGSRPARRRSGSGIQSLRAIPWVFAWTQTRMMLPAWLGVGEALREALDKGQAQQLRDMELNWPFFSTTLDLVEMVLAKGDPDVALLYDAVLVPENLRPLGDELRQRFADTVQTVLEITEHQKLMENHPIILGSIKVRNPYVDLLNLLQVQVLQRLRAGEEGFLRDALFATINGIAAGMRNTG